MEEVLGVGTIEKLMMTGGMRPVSDGTLHIIEGVPFTSLVTSSTIEALKTWQARQDDAFIVTYPKAGTTWTQEIVSAICNDGDIDKLNKSHTMWRVPFMEANLLQSTKEIKMPPTYELINKMKSPRTIKSHLPGHMLPPDIWQKRSRVVYVARNPKDLVVSYYHMHQMMPTLKSYPWNEFFDNFCSGNINFGPWWSHYLYYWHKRHEPNVLFLKFEDMKQDLKGAVNKIATFLGHNFTDDVIQAITSHCSFANMKANPMTNPDYIIKMLHEVAAKQRASTGGEPGTEKIAPSKDDKPKAPASFMRKGQVGGWRGLFTVAQNEIMDALIEEKLAGTGLSFEY